MRPKLCCSTCCPAQFSAQAFPSTTTRPVGAGSSSPGGARRSGPGAVGRRLSRSMSLRVHFHIRWDMMGGAGHAFASCKASIPPRAALASRRAYLAADWAVRSPGAFPPCVRTRALAARIAELACCST
jgi:hypothetical protein